MNVQGLPNARKMAKSMSVLHYYTGKPCKYGHMSIRQTSDAACVECKRLQNRDNAEYHKNYYRQNREAIIARNIARHHTLKEQDVDYEKKRYVKNRETQKLYRQTHKVSRNAQKREWHLKNREHVLQYAKKYNSTVSSDKKREQGRKNYKAHKNRFIAAVALRRAAKLKRTPLWLSEDDKITIKFIYKIAERVSIETGVKHHVDHKLPLQGKLVSGLHIPGNLQLLTAVENLAKSNKFINTEFM